MTDSLREPLLWRPSTTGSGDDGRHGDDPQNENDEIDDGVFLKTPTTSLELTLTLTSQPDDHASPISSTPAAAIASSTLQHDSNNSSKSWFLSTMVDRHGSCARMVLIFVSFLFATFNISARAVYSFDNSPSPSVFSAIRGYMVVIFFGPLLVQQRYYKSTNVTRSQPDGDVINAGDEDVETDAGFSQSPPPSPSSLLEASSSYGMASSLCLSAIELSVWNFISQACYNVGIMSVSSSARASFLGQSSVIMTPFIVVAISSSQNVSSSTWLGCFVAMIGLSFLSLTPSSSSSAATPTHDPSSDYDSGGGTNNGTASITMTSFMILSNLMTGGGDELNTSEDDNQSSSSPSSTTIGLSFGDWMILLSSATWSLYIIRTCAHSTNFEEVYLQGLKNVFIAVFYTGWWMIDSHFGRDNLWIGWNGPMAWTSLSIMAYSALGPGVLADLLQQNAQGSVPASETNIILSMEPIFTVGLGLSLLGENLSWNESVGGCFLVLGSLVASGMSKTASSVSLAPEH